MWTGREKKMPAEPQDKRSTQDAPENFARLIAEVRAGSEDAARELVEFYSPHILGVVRRTLSRELRKKFDSADFVQAVWKSLFSERAELQDFESPHALVAYLAGMARNKVAEEFRRRLQTAKYDVRKEVSLDDSRMNHADRVVSREPTPSQMAVAREKLEKLTEGLSDLHREIVRMRLEGSTYQSIAIALDVNERTVRRLLKKVDVS